MGSARNRRGWLRLGAMRMSAGSQHPAGRGIRRAALMAAGLWLVASSAGIATAQAPGQESAPAATAGAPPPPPDKPGLITSFGNWVQQGFANMGTGFGTMMGALRGGADQAARNAADAASTAAGTATSIARDTATTVTRLPATGIIGGRWRHRCIFASCARNHAGSPRGAKRTEPLHANHLARETR